MRAIELQAFGGPEVMEVVDRPDPVPAANEVLIDVTAIGVNFADTHVTSNDYLAPQTLPLIPGGEVVGTLADGRRVLAAVSNGGYAQRVAANAATVYDIPDGVSDEQALCLLVQGLTAWHTLATLGRLKPGETVVIHAAAGGVGTLAIQLAKMWGGFVIAVASGEAKAELALLDSAGKIKYAEDVREIERRLQIAISCPRLPPSPLIASASTSVT